jgi:hypothetical protein
MNDKAILGAGAGLGGTLGGAVAPGIAALKAEYTLPEILDQVNKYTQGHYTVGDIASHARDVVKEPYRLLRKSVQDHGLVEGLVHQPEIAAQIAGGATAGGALGLDLAQRHVDANNTIMKRLGRLVGRHPIAAGAAGLGALGLGAYGLMNHDSGSITDGVRAHYKEGSMASYTFAQAVNEGISKVAFDSEDQVADALIPTFGGPLGSALTAPGGRWINGPLREMLRGTFEGGVGGMAGTAGGGLLGAALGAALRRPELGAVGMALGGGIGSTAGAMHGAYASRRNQRKETGDYSTLGHRRDKDKQKKPKRDDD